MRSLYRTRYADVPTMLQIRYVVFIFLVSFDLFHQDDVMIPLLLETIPSAKEFKDAIESLSPEQQRFAKAYRSMQLESTLFGVCVLQIKPQMERLLRLPEGSLTKEIDLTQDLMKLFMEYQLPSDLVSFNGKETATAEERIQQVCSIASIWPLDQI